MTEISSPDQAPPPSSNSVGPDPAARPILIASLLVLSGALVILLARLLAFEFIVEATSRIWSTDGVVSPAAESLLKNVLMAGALTGTSLGLFLLGFTNRKWRRIVAAAIRWDPLRVSGLATPNPFHVLASSAALGLGIITLWYVKNRLSGVSLLFTKEGPFEIATFLLDMGGGVLCVIAAVRWRRHISGFPSSVPILFVFCALALFLVGMEEINWGQTLIPFETPAGWAAINYQQETSLHNLADRDTLTAAWKFVSSAFALVVISLVAWAACSPRSTIGAIAPHSSLLLLALMTACAGAWLHPEVAELLLAIFFAFYSYRIYVAASSNIVPRPRTLQAGARAFIALGLVALLLTRVDVTQVTRDISRISLLGLGGVFGLMCLGLVVSAWKWSQSLRMHDLHYSFSYVLRALATGFFINNFLPTAIGGDAYRVYRTLPREHYRSRALSAVAVERAMGFLVLLALGGLGALMLIDRFDAARIYCVVLLTLSVAGTAGFIALEKGWFHNAGGRRSAARLVDAVRHNLALLHNRRSEWLVLAAQSAAFQVVSIGTLFVLFNLLDLQATFAQCALIAAVTGVAVILPISINGIGVMEGTLVATAVMLGIDYDQALVVAFARRFLATLLGAGCGLLYLFESRRADAASRPKLRQLLRTFRERGTIAAWEALQPQAVPAVTDSQPADVSDIPLQPVHVARLDAMSCWDTELLEYTHDAIIIWEMNGAGILYWNRAAELLYGYDRSEAHGKITHELLRTRLAGGVSRLEKTLARFGVWVGELQHTTRSGLTVRVDARLTLLSQHNGRWLVLEVNRDVTDQKAAETARVAAERQLAGLHALRRSQS